MIHVPLSYQHDLKGTPTPQRDKHNLAKPPSLEKKYTTMSHNQHSLITTDTGFVMFHFVSQQSFGFPCT